MARLHEKLQRYWDRLDAGLTHEDSADVLQRICDIQQAEIERLQAVEELLRQAFDGEVTYDDFGQWYDECQEVFGRVSQTHEEVSDDE